MATVAAVCTRVPWVRTPQQIIESLFRICPRTPGDGPTPPRPGNKRVWARLLKDKTAVMQEVAEETDRRDPYGVKTRVALTGGERALQIRVDRKLSVTIIPDLIHVLEKRWKAASVFHAEGSLEADRTLRILSGAKRKTLAEVAGYLYRNRTRMRYDEYLANGWPIAMRWTGRMAEAIVQLRAIYLP